MAGEGRSPIVKSDSSFYGGGSSSGTPGCATPRHHWRSVSWTARSRERNAAAGTAVAASPLSSLRPTVATENALENRDGEGEDSVPEGSTNSSNSKGDNIDPVAKQTQLLCPPLSNLSISRRTGDGNSGGGLGFGKAQASGAATGAATGGAAAVGDERKGYKKFGRGRNGMDIKLDLVAVRQVNFQENDAAEPTDTELSQKREKMALCEKQCSRIRSNLYFGSSVVAQDFDMLRSNKITHIVNCVGYVCSEYFPDNFEYRVLWLQDSPSEDIFSVLYDCFDFFEDVRLQGGRVYVHCCQGVSRSAAIVIAYLMWRESRTFEDVFEDVKSLRTVTSPNMGFVFQLMNWQSRILGSPKTPSLRMFRMAPHSPYDPLHQVPKAVAHPSMSALDSRGAFVIHFANKLYIWLGRHCGKCMAAAADKVAFQLIRYERANSTILPAREGSEPQELKDALMNSVFAVRDGGSGHSTDGGHEASPTANEKLSSVNESLASGPDGGGGGQVQNMVDSGNETPKLLVNHLYDADFEAFDKARSGEVLASLPDGANLRGWDGRWNTPRHDFCCGVLSSRIKR
ncbi:unnamed protein product [Calypogeia fissa]